jgi:succinate dehydrogenase / fumarate reductase, iron-sulfur subunit
MNPTDSIDPRSAEPTANGGATGRTVTIRIRRQDSPDKPGTQRWEEFAVPHRPNMTIISCLQWIAANPTTTDGKATTTPVWDSGCLEEVCGACTMVINGRVRQACSALVDRVAQSGETITLEPMSKFPLVRDLFVDRSRFFEDLKRVKAWVPIDGTYDLGKGPPVSQKQQETAYPLSRCMTCGCCLEACPQYTPSNHFVGAAVISQARLFNEHPTGKALKDERIESLMGEGGVGDCGKAGNCAEVCPKDIPLLESIAAVQRQATVYSLKKFFTK